LTAAEQARYALPYLVCTRVTGKDHRLVLRNIQSNNGIRSIRFIQRRVDPFTKPLIFRHKPHVLSLAWSHNECHCHVYFRAFSSLYPLDALARGLGCRGWLASSAARGSSINSHQDENRARGQTRWVAVTVVDLVGPEITAVSWIESAYGRDAPSRGQGQNWVSAMWD